MILLNDFKRQWADVGSEMLETLEEVGAGGWYVLGSHVRDFEAALARHWGTADSVGVASGLDALEISLRVLGCKAGDRVLTSPISAFATTLAILKIGAVPVFVDCDRFGLIDLAACRRVLREDAGIRFFVPVHLYGHCLDLEEVGRLRAEFSLGVVEDCAQSIGSSFRGRGTGSAGQLAATSFYPTKNLGTLGDGGAVLVHDPEHARLARCLRDYGQSSKYRHEVVGYNSRLDELHAAFLGRVFLPRVAGWTARRRAIAGAFVDGISHPGICVPGAPPDSESVWHLFPVLVAADRKASFMGHLRERGVMTAEHYPLTLFDQPVMKTVRFERKGECLAAVQFCGREVSLPIHPYLFDDEVAGVVSACNSWAG